MMLDEPIEWNDSVDKEKVLDYAIHNQRITKANQAMLDQYRATEDEFIGRTLYNLFKNDLESCRNICRQLFDNGHWYTKTSECRMDDTIMCVEGDYICLYDDEGKY